MISESQETDLTSPNSQRTHSNLVLETKKVESKPKIVEAYNMAYIVSKIETDEVREAFEGTLTRYLKS